MVIDAIAETPWHLFGPEVRRHLIVMMKNSQVPFQFTCGKLFNVDLRLFVLVSTARVNWMWIYGIQ